MGSLWGDAWTSFKAVYGPISSGAALVLAVLGELYAPATSIEVRVMWLVLVALVALIVAMTVIDMLVAARRLAKLRLPKVIHVDVSMPIVEGEPEPVTLLFERSELFGLNQPVRFFYAEKLETGQLFERDIGSGRVLNVQMDGLIQVRVLNIVSNQRDLWQRIRSREAAVLSQVVIRPSTMIDEDESRGL